MSVMNAILNNMYDQNSIQRESESKVRFITSKKDFIIELERQEISNSNFQLENANCYTCSVIIRDRISNNILLKLDFNINQILIILDNLNSYFIGGDNLFDLNLISNVINSSNMSSTFSLTVYHNYDTYDKQIEDFIHVLEIDENNSFYNSSIPRFKIDFFTNDLLTLMDLMYFTFLIDVVSTEEIYAQSEVSTIDYGVLYGQFECENQIKNN